MPPLVKKVANAVLVVAVFAFIAYLRSRESEERLPKVTTSLGWLTGCAVLGSACSGYLLCAAPEKGADMAEAVVFILMIGMVYLVAPSVIRLIRSLRGSGAPRFAALLGLGIVLALASLSPLAVFYHYIMTQ